MTLSPQESEWLFALQRPWPLEPRPLAALAAQLATTEAALVAFIDRLRAAGLVRRIGGVFDARRLGYRSSLFALEAQGEALERAAEEVCALPGVTHCYTRVPPQALPERASAGAMLPPFPNLWYTLSAPHEIFEAEAAKLAHLRPIALPALTRYKIDVVFDTRTHRRDERTEYAAPHQIRPSAPLSPDQRALVRRYQDDTLCASDPFCADDLTQLRAWQADGTLRRFALLLYHRAGGFTANGMCCWRVPEAACDDFGRRLAASAEVTHCYARPLFEAFPFNLYAMIHKTSWESGEATFRHLTELAGLPDDGTILFSTREYKKRSLRFFEEAPPPAP